MLFLSLNQISILDLIKKLLVSFSDVSNPALRVQLKDICKVEMNGNRQHDPFPEVHKID